MDKLFIEVLHLTTRAMEAAGVLVIVFGVGIAAVGFF